MRLAPSAEPAATSDGAGPGVPRESWMDTEPLELTEGAELIEGANGEPMLFHPGRGTYTRLSATGVRLVGLLDGRRTGTELSDALARGDHAERVQAAVVRFLAELRQAHLLNVAARPEDRRERLVRGASSQHLVRFPLVHRFDRVLAPVAGPVSRLPAVAARRVLACALLVAGGLVVAALVSRGVPPQGVAWPLLIGLLLVQLAFHETAHGLVGQLYGAPPREAGIGLLFGFWPIAYVDRTDSYRIRERSRRAAIVLAGPVNDMLWAGAFAAIALSASGMLGATANALVILEVLGLLMTLNPLLPTDGYQAIEAASGELNLRGRAFSYCAHRLTRTPLSSSLASVSRSRVTLYWVFTLGCVTYVAVLAASLAFTVAGLAGLEVGL